MKLFKSSLAVFLAVAVAVGFTACNKKDPDEGQNTPENTVPDNFVKKVVVEEVTGEWCAACPDGAQKLEDLLKTYGAKLAVISVHQGDPFERQDYYNELATLQAAVSGDNTISFPSAAFDRRLWNQGKALLLTLIDGWDAPVQEQMGKPADAGIYIESNIAEQKLYITVYIASKTAYSNLRLMVAITENDVPESAPGAQEGADAGYVHQHVLREYPTGAQGEAISLEPGNVWKKTYTFDLATTDYKTDKLEVVAYIRHHDPANKNYTVINAQKTKAGQSSGWN